MSGRRIRILGILVLMVTFALDQASKWLMLNRILSPERPGIEVTWFFNLVMVWNKGISFGMFAGENAALALTALSLAIVCVLLCWLYKNTLPLVTVALGLITGGAIGNIADRLRFGAVVDFLDVHAGHYHWPAFNVADSAIFIGVVLLCTGSMFSKRLKG